MTKLTQAAIDRVMAGAKELSDCLFEQRLRQFERAQRADCNWSSQEIAQWQREARAAYEIWCRTELCMIEAEFFDLPADEAPEQRVLLQ